VATRYANRLVAKVDAVVTRDTKGSFSALCAVQPDLVLQSDWPVAGRSL